MKLQLETVRLGYSVKSYIPTNHSSKYNINPPTSNNSPKFSELFVLLLFNIISFYEHQTPIYQLHLPRKKEIQVCIPTAESQTNGVVRPGIVRSTSTMNGTAASNLNSILRIRSH
jgi:hypothetical protein